MRKRSHNLFVADTLIPQGIFNAQTHDWGFCRFMQKSTALDPMAGYLKDGQMIVGVHISLPGTLAVNSSSLAFLPCVF